MDFERSDDQRQLADAIRRQLEGRLGLDRLRAVEGRSQVVDPGWWGELADAGVFALAAPESAGGLGLGVAAAAVVFEELGRGLVPGPLVASAVAATVAGAAGAGAADGRVRVGSVRRPPAGGGPVLVEHLGDLERLVVVDDAAAELAVVDPGGLEARPVARSLDPLTPLGQLDALPPGEPVADRHAYHRWRWHEAVLTGALAVGLADATLALAVAHAQTRQQFGRPIGAFQAVKHLCADMLVRAETARAAVEAAAVTLDQPDVGDPVRAAAGAALVATEAAVANARSCLQVHGGMGFTWELPVHLYLMRSKVLASSLGPAADLAATVADRY